jgi:hypothetical protein
MHDLNGGFTQIKLGSLKDLECKVTSKVAGGSKYAKMRTMRRTAPAEEGCAIFSPEIQVDAVVPKGLNLILSPS